MKKKYSALAGIVLSATLLTACNSNTTATNSEEKELTKEEKIVEDQTGREVKIKKDPDSIVVGGILPYFSTWFVGTNSTKEIKGLHPNAYNAAENSILSKISPDIKKASTEFVKNGDVNIEELSKINPDVYFENATEQKTLDKVAESGIPTMGLETIKVEDADPLATFNSWLKVTSDVKGGKTSDRTEKFMKEGEKSQKMIDDGLKGTKKSDKPKVLFLHQHTDNSIVVGGGNFFSEKWTEATVGIDDVGDDGVDGQKEVNMEQIYKWNPDKIYITNFTETQPNDLLKNKVSGQDWSQVKAVKDKAVYKVPLGIYRWFPPNGDAPLMLKWMAQHNHPDKFNYDMKDEIKSYYQDFYDYKLSDEDVESILHPSSDAAKY